MQKFEIKETGESWETDIGNTQIDPDTLEFIYQNGIKYLEATINSMKVIADRSLLLLLYLLIMIGFSINNLILYVLKNGFNYMTTIGILFTFYYAWISWNIIVYIKPRKAYTTHTEPKALLQKKMIETGYHNIKIVRCIEIQHDIYVNRRLMNTMFAKFESAIAYTFIFPVLCIFISKIKNRNND